MRFLSTSLAQTKAHTIAIIGAGPAGFYSAHRLLKENPNVHVHMYNSEISPFGLIRYGVAPDHADVKNVTHKFDQVAESNRFHYFGKVPIGNQVLNGVSLTDLYNKGYTALILAYGAASADKQFNICGEHDLGNIFSARSFVGWYNGLPECADLQVDLKAGETALIFGQGNVALDIARILLSPIDVLRKTDIAMHALDALSESTIRHVHIIGRRGPLQVAFTAKELRELMSLPNTQIQMDAEFFKSEMQINENIIAENRPLKRLMGILGSTVDSQPPIVCDRSCKLDFLKSPLSFHAKHRSHMVGSVRLAQNVLVRQLSGNTVAQIIEPLTASVIHTSMIVKSIGYTGNPIDTAIPFNTKSSTVIHTNGKVRDNLYVAGWLKSGPSGVIASTMRCAYQTVDLLLQDLACHHGSPPYIHLDRNHISNWLASTYGHRVITWAGWQKISAHEKTRLDGHKVVRVDDMLRIANNGR